MAISRVCVFCASSRQCDPGYGRAAREVGRELAAAGMQVVYGGGSTGLMGALADGALEGLPELPALNQLFLAKLPVSDDDVVALVRKYPNLIAIALHDSKVTDAGMATVAKLEFLERVYLDGTSVSDKGLQLLANCEKLRMVSALRTAITPEGVGELQGVLPECKVSLGK